MSDNGKIMPIMARIQAVLAACKQAVEMEGMDWDDVMVRRTRLRKVVEVRYAIFDIFRKAVPVSFGTETEMLGTSLNRTSLYHAIEAVEQWRSYDGIYSGIYDRIFANFHSALLQAGCGESEGTV